MRMGVSGKLEAFELGQRLAAKLELDDDDEGKSGSPDELSFRAQVRP